MTWRKYFKVADTSGKMSPISGVGNRPTADSFGFRNYQSSLPDIYTGHPNRIERYNQYEAMDMDSEVNACLDIIAEFCTQVNATTNSAFDVHYYETPSDNEIKMITQQLQQWVKLNEFDKRLFKVFRNTIKYGDQVFVRDPETFKLQWVETNKVMRVIVNESEGKAPEQYIIQDINPNFENLTVAAKTTSDYQSTPPGGGYTAPYTYNIPNMPNANAGRFANGIKESVIDAAHVCHLSLTEGLDYNWPFGQSILEQIFKVYKQKELLEDAILIYRIQRAPERRVFYIDVGDMPSHLAMGFVERVKNEIHQRRIPSQSGGSNALDASYSPMSTNEDYFFPQCLSQNTIIPLLDGRELTLRDIISEYTAGKVNYAYSLNLATSEIEPGKITWAGVTRLNAEIVRVQLDNGEYVDATPDHRFILRDGTECQAQDLKSDDSLMPLYLFNRDANPHVVSVDVLPYQEDTCDITVEGPSNSHVFATSAGVYVHNSADSRGSKVEVLPGGCFSMDTRVSLLDGRDLSIAEIEEEMKSGSTLWTYSCNPLTGAIVPGLISWAGVTQKNARVMKLTLNNGEEIICTPDHKFPQYNEDFKQAADFKVGDSLIPLYKETAHVGENKKADYETIFDNELKEWVYTHRMVADYFKDDRCNHEVFDEGQATGNYDVRHHKDFNRHNNSPENLSWMSWHDHCALHKSYGFSPASQKLGTLAASKKLKYLKENEPEQYAEHCAKISKRNVIRNAAMSPEEKYKIYQKVSKSLSKYIANLSPEEKAVRDEYSRKGLRIASAQKVARMKIDPEYREWVCKQQSDCWTDEMRGATSKFMTARNFKDWKNNHKRKKEHSARQTIEYSHNMLKSLIGIVKSSESITLTEATNRLNDNMQAVAELRTINRGKAIRNRQSLDAFLIRNVDSLVRRFGYNGWSDFKKKEKYHNHTIAKIEYLDSRIDVGTLTIDNDEQYHDYHTFALSCGVFTKNSNLSEIDDLKYFNNKMARGLRVPSSYLPSGPEESGQAFNDGRVGTALIQEFRFNQYCERLQNTIISNLTKEFKMFMQWRGFNIDSKIFDLKFNMPQNFASTRQADMDTVRLGNFAGVADIPYMSKRFALKRFLGLSEEEMLENELLWREENNVLGDTAIVSGSDLRGVGVSPGDMSADLDTMDEFSEPEEDEPPGDEPEGDEPPGGELP